MTRFAVVGAILLMALHAATAVAATAKITVSADQPGVRVSPLLYGIFFEEINRAGDGGLYAEMVQNRSFEDDAKAAAWTIAGGDVAVVKEHPLNAKNLSSLRIKATSPVTIANDGFHGIAVKSRGEYVASFYARGDPAAVGVEIQSADGKTLAKQSIDVGGEWKRFECTLKVAADSSYSKLVLSVAKGTIWLDVVSLMPKQTWKGHGLRPDLAEMLADMRPGFVRFPGGCWVEGETLDQVYRWKETIGDISQRRNQYNLWKYHSTHGLGYHEYLQLCEDLAAEPLFVINCGMSHKQVAPMDQMQPYVQDALDAIEYANGPADSTWGALRAKHGHPKPFKLKYMEIGNENGGKEYRERYALMAEAIKKRYPEMNLIADVWQGRPSGPNIEILDEHYYSDPNFFITNSNKYDSYDRKGPRIYCGEYAVTQGCGNGNLRAAVAEAAFIAGMERNSDVVTMSSYAPLFCNVHYEAWNPNAINFDASRVYGTPSYYVQQMFSRNRPDAIVPAEVSVADEPAVVRRGAVGVGTWGTQAEFKDLVVARSDYRLPASEWEFRKGKWHEADGALHQSSDVEGAFAIAGSKTWSDITYSLKARKTGGREGFLIVFQSTDDDNYTMWNIGGWNNTKHQIEQSVAGRKSPIGDAVAGKIETGRWYNVRVMLKDDRIRCYLDDELIHDVTYPRPRPLQAVAGVKADEVIVKVINSSDRAYVTELRIEGVKQVSSPAKMIELTSKTGDDENSLDQPRNVAPVESDVAIINSGIQREFPANSVTVIRAATK